MPVTVEPFIDAVPGRGGFTVVDERGPYACSAETESSLVEKCVRIEAHDPNDDPSGAIDGGGRDPKERLTV